MNAESTPIREISNTFFDEVFLELTPIREKKNSERGEKKKKNNSKFALKGRKNFKSKEIRKMHSQKRKKESDKSQKKVFIIDENSEISNSDSVCSGDLDDHMTGLLYKVIESPNESVGEDKSSEICNTGSVNSEQRVELKRTSSTIVKNESINKILSVSDVMKWSDDSLIPTEKSNLSEQLIKKLRENVSKKEVVKSQTSGWTQFDLDSSKNGYNEVGPFFGLPSKVQKLYEEVKGIKELYPWQKECLSLEAVKHHKNLVYALPTSGGKTLVAEILILREVFCHRRNVLFILPFVSIVQEKIRDFSQFALELDFIVEEYAAGKGVIPPRKRRRKNSVLIATIEKASVVLNSLIEAKRLEEFGLIVVDELHLVSDGLRGVILESLLTQILYMKKGIQIIGMTATIGNLEEVARFLKAESYTGNFRPVRLSEYVKCVSKVYEIDAMSQEMREVRDVGPVRDDRDPDGIALLVQEVVPKDSVLVFCATKKNCENVALLLCSILPKTLLRHREEEKKSLYKALVSETNDQICPTLRKTISLGVAYHHSGLTAGERKLLEESFRDGTLSVICCTSTLAAGVNLPAQRVILRSPFVGREFISLSKYKQMVGRAGRTGFGSEGDSYLICQPEDCERVANLFRSQMDEATSKMDADNCKNLVLAGIGLGIATTRKALKELLSCTLLHLQVSKNNKDSRKIVDACISSLYKQGALKIKSSEAEGKEEISTSGLELNGTRGKMSLKVTNDSQLVVSRLGRAAMKGGLSLEKAHELYGDLVKAQSSLVLLTSLHLLFVVTPYDLLSQIRPNFSVYFNVYMQLDSKEAHTAKIIGITESVMSKLVTGNKPKNVDEAVLNRFYISLILNELWKQQTIWDVALLFQLPRGLVQTLMTSASTFANSVLRFCEELEELWSFKSLLSTFAPRLAHCCATELLPLMDLPAVRRGRAKQLYDAGYKTLPLLAAAEPLDLVRSVDNLSKKVASQVVAAAKLLLMEKAENLKEEAEDVLEGLAQKSAPKET